MTETKLEPELEELLKKRGYRVIEKIGQGHTRDVYVVEYTNGSLQKRRVMKVPKNEIDETSVTTVINRSKGDLDEREVLALNKVSHPHIIEIFDAFKIGDKTVTIEEHYDAMSLEDMLKWSGPIKDPEHFKHIFGQVAAALKHLHVNEGILHRDINPSNILIGKDTVKLSDLQTAGKLDEITESFLPTRGGTKFTSPHILNALFSGKPTAANIQSEFYALGATMYYALTRQPLFDTELVADENGRTINVNGRFIKAELKQNDQKVHSIDIDKHDVLVKERLKQVPRQYRRLLFNCLSVKNPKYTDQRTHNNFAEDFERATSKLPSLIRKIRDHTVLYSTIAATIAGMIGGAGLIITLNKRIPEPEVHETLSHGILTDARLGYVLTPENKPSLDSLIDYFKEIKEKSPEHYTKRRGGWPHPMAVACDINKMSRRLGYSLIRSIELEDEKAISEEYGNTRIMKLLVPKDFAEKMGDKLLNDYSKYTKSEDYGLTTWYLRACLWKKESLTEVFADYFCEPEEIFEARRKAGTIQYFPTADKPGYGAYLSQTKRNLINRALALYYITDNEGVVHVEILDSNNKPTKGLADK